MKIPAEASVLRVYIGQSDKKGRRPLYEVLVEEARKRGLAGATVFRGILGFGANSRIHSSKILRLSEDLPVIVEIVDSEEKIDALLPVFDELMTEGLMTLDKVRVLAYRHNSKE